ncbi:MAG: pilus assembly protein TadG-related protein, partial [Hyphomonadaceae bacterium]
LWALSAVVLVAMVGLSVDFARAQTLRAKMQNAADGAVLVAERSSSLTLEERQTAARAFFDASFGNQAMTGPLDFNLAELDDGGHRVTASMTLDMGLTRLISNTPWRVAVASEAMAQASPPIEVVLALDNTGSMNNDMGTLRDSAQELAEFLLRIDGGSVSVGIVPFVAQVNIGTSNTAWMDTAGANPHHGEMFEDRYLGWRNNSSNSSTGNCNSTTTYPTTYGGFAVRWVKGPITGISGSTSSRCYAFSPSTVNIYSLYANLPTNAQWGGCVEARPEPYDITDDAPVSTTPATMFVPFFSMDEGGDETDGDNNDNDGNNWITSTTYDRTNVLGLSGSPTWNAATGVRTLGVYKYRSGVTVSVANNTIGRGPNRGCPTPIVPLSTDEDTVVDAIQAMQHWYGGGTNQIEGLAWAWRVISPGAPFTQGRPYNDPNDPVRKVIVLFTDGDNTSLNDYGSTLESEYSALSHRRLWRDFQYATQPTAGLPGLAATWRRIVTGLDGSNDDDDMVAYMNTRQGLLCEAIKDAGIEIYTVGFRITDGGTADLLLEACATDDGEHYFHASNATELQTAFRAIGSGIGDLRITH